MEGEEMDSMEVQEPTTTAAEADGVVEKREDARLCALLPIVYRTGRVGVVSLGFILLLALGYRSPDLVGNRWRRTSIVTQNLGGHAEEASQGQSLSDQAEEASQGRNLSYHAEEASVVTQNPGDQAEEASVVTQNLGGQSEGASVVTQNLGGQAEGASQDLASGSSGEDGPTWPSRLLFQQDGCPYSISEHQAEYSINNHEPGNTISIGHFGGGRTGNRFEILSIVLSMGYCCRSRMVSLPQKDEDLPAESKGAFESHQRFFSFSNAVLQSDEYKRLRDDPETCLPNWELSVESVFYLRGFSHTLMNCVNEVYVRGCERAYLGPTLDKELICAQPDPAAKTGAGSLVIHIRSGDIMGDDGGKGLFAKYGQPPLQLYLHAIYAKRWDAVTIVTWSKYEALLNPTYKMLEMMAATGVLGPNVRFFWTRSLWEDLREMICADGLVASRSSLSFPMVALSRASVYVTPGTCGMGTWRREKNPDPKLKDTYDNTTLLLAEKPNTEVFGIDWDEASRPYTIYQHWDTSDRAQRMEMVLFAGVKGLQRCH